MGYSVCTLKQPSYNIKFNYLKEIIKHLIKRETNIYQIKRNNRFKKFNKKYISLGDELKDKCDLTKINYKYDYFICGSDQVWNVRYDFIYKNINNYLASFANPEKRIAYAASFGTSNVSEKTKYIFKQELSKGNPMLLSSANVPLRGRDFLKDLDNMSFSECFKKYSKESSIKKICKKIKMKIKYIVKS